MAFFDELGKKVSGAGQGAMQSAKNFAAVTKINGMVSDEEKKINSMYYQIGKTYFQIHQDSQEENFVEYIASIRKSLSLIEDYKEQIKEIKGISNCPNCNAEVPYTSAFCNVCGTKMPVHKKSMPQAANTLKCGNCGAAVPLGYKFCTTCGNVMNTELSNQNANIQPQTTQQTKVNNCPNCGKELEDGAMFCTGCGHQL